MIEQLESEEKKCITLQTHLIYYNRYYWIFIIFFIQSRSTLKFKWNQWLKAESLLTREQNKINLIDHPKWRRTLCFARWIIFLELLTGATSVIRTYRTGGISRGFYWRRGLVGCSMKLESCEMCLIRSFRCMVTEHEHSHGEYAAEPKKITAESFIRFFMSPQRRILKTHFRV